jgi:hypothetical protein
MALKHYSSLNKASKNLGVRWHFLSKVCSSKDDELFDEKPRNPSIAEEIQDEVKTFYKCPEVSNFRRSRKCKQARRNRSLPHRESCQCVQEI